MKAHQEMVYSSTPQGSRPSQDANIDVLRSENQSTSGLKWKGKTAMITGQLQIEDVQKLIRLFSLFY